MSPEKRSGPGGSTLQGHRNAFIAFDGPSVTLAEDIRPLLLAAAELIDQIGDQARREEEIYWRGWRDSARVFLAHGVEIGRQQLSNELLEQDRRRMAAMHDVFVSPSYDELEKLRYPGYTREQLRELREWCPA